MNEDKPYITYKFTGMKSIQSVFTEGGISTRILQDASIKKIFENNTDLFNSAEDTIELGICSREGKDLYFIEFGISLDGIYKSFFTFMYDHHPNLEEMQKTADDIELVIHQNLLKIKEEMESEKQKNETIN